MKKFVIFVMFILMMVGSQVMADPEDHLRLNWERQLNPTQCDYVGSPVINVTYRVINDADSGEAGNYWAFDRLNRHLQVWLQQDESYCVLVQMEGRFDAVAGQRSPGNTGFLTGSEDGSVEGGYRAIIHGALLSNPTWPTRGNLGTLDYQCDLSGNCPGAVSWPAQYFAAGYSFDYAWWGWIYRGEEDATWINSSDGNSGDVISSETDD
ncbi:MAG: hypothetical protein K8L97_09315 [Anaerolineae bacterium]|nr:hypothetical protein [Anaerolineae bacterium]